MEVPVVTGLPERVRPASPPSRFTSDDAVAALVGADMNVYLAAERSGFGSGLEPANQFRAVLMRDPGVLPKLAHAMRVKGALKAFDSVMSLLDGLPSILDLETTEPRDYVKAMQVVSKLLEGFIGRPDAPQVQMNNQVNVNLFDQILKASPPDIREAVRVLGEAEVLDVSAMQDRDG